jgi:hypothetical protein
VAREYAATFSGMPGVITFGAGVTAFLLKEGLACAPARATAIGLKRFSARWPPSSLSTTPCAASRDIARARECPQLDPRRNADLAEDAAQVCLDRLLAQEQLARDFRIGLAVDHELCKLVLTRGEPLKGDTTAVPGSFAVSESVGSSAPSPSAAGRASTADGTAVWSQGTGGTT